MLNKLRKKFLLGVAIVTTVILPTVLAPAIQANATHFEGSPYEIIFIDKDIIQEGDTGYAVEWVQYKLNVKGYNAGKADGIFGPATEKAVKWFQRDHNLKADGMVGINTYRAM